MNQPVGHPSVTNHAASLAASMSQQSTAAQYPPPPQQQDDDVGEPSSLDHALLESLFYSEMMMLDATTPPDHSVGDGIESLPQTTLPSITTTTDQQQQQHGIGAAFPSVNAPFSTANSDQKSISASSELLTQHLVDAAHIQQQQQNVVPSTGDEQQNRLQQEMNSFVEHEILRDFEMTTSNVADGTVAMPNTATTGGQWNHSSTGIISQSTGSFQMEEPVGLPLDSTPDTTAPPNKGIAAPVARTAVNNQLGPAAVSNSAYLTHNATTGTVHRQQQQPPMFGKTPSLAQPRGHPAPLQRAESFVAAEVSQTQGVPQDRARQLVDQFATLASRLGIDLPDNVLQSLTTAAARNDPSCSTDSAVAAHPQMMTAPNHQSIGASTLPASLTNASNARKRPSSVAFAHPDTTATTPAGSNPSVVSENTSTVNLPPPTILESQKVAEESIAAATQQQQPLLESTSSDKAMIPSGPVGTHGEAGSASQGSVAPIMPQKPAPTIQNTASSQGKAPTYSKRRKKPRMQECEAKLAQLRAENQQLKRHLENISNKAHKFDKEKEDAMKGVEQLMYENAGSDKISKAVNEITSKYSDYGVNRQQELTFHLEQLQRLVNPTNFTKMGLYSLSQNTHDHKKNPIAGILVKELTITSQQGRKILDQSEKIRNLCQNLKETHALLGKLKALCEKKTKIFQDRMSKCTEILTSKQVVSLIVWINEHTELLETVCPGWGTEHIHNAK